jgi:hypothetical protein
LKLQAQLNKVKGEQNVLACENTLDCHAHSNQMCDVNVHAIFGQGPKWLKIDLPSFLSKLVLNYFIM